jgi:hypothetical protein
VSNLPVLQAVAGRHGRSPATLAAPLPFRWVQDAQKHVETAHPTISTLQLAFAVAVCGLRAGAIRLAPRLVLTGPIAKKLALCILYHVVEPERLSLDPTTGSTVIAFGAAESCSPASRAAVAVAIDLLNDWVTEDLNDVAAGNEPTNTQAYLPPAWQIGLDKDFMTGMARAMSEVKAGMSDLGWRGPANTAEELCLKAIFDHAHDVVPDIYQVDKARLADDVMYLGEMGFQDIDHEFLFEPEMDGIDKTELGAELGMQSLSRRDAFVRFSNR